MAVPKARITIDLPPELRRQLKVAAAQADMSMREFVTESVRRDLGWPRRPESSSAGLARPEEHFLDGGMLSVNAPQQSAAEQFVAPLRTGLDELIADADRALQAEQRRATDAAVRRFCEELTGAGSSDDLKDRLRAGLAETFESVRQTYLSHLRRVGEAQLAAIMHELDPFARDWDSEEDSIYDDVE